MFLFHWEPSKPLLASPPSGLPPALSPVPFLSVPLEQDRGCFQPHLTQPVDSRRRLDRLLAASQPSQQD